jgi:N4-gp56 family major capsid protein
MAETVLSTALERQVWITKYFQEYVRTSRFMPYMSNADINKGGIILTKFQREDEAFRTINIPFIGRLKSAGVTGATVLDGSEEELTNFNCPITIDWRRNAVRLPKSTTFRTEVNLWDAAKDALMVWESEKLRDDIIHALTMCVVDTAGTIAFYDQATSAQQNTWVVANQDRVLFGSNIGDYSGTFATAMGNITTGMTASSAMVSKAKRQAKQADPHIRPFRVEDGDGREYYVLFSGSRTFRDLKLDSNIVSANSNARAREGMGMEKNPIFQDGDLLWDGVIIREIPEIDTYCGAIANPNQGTEFNQVGGSGGDVRPMFLCGGGAVGVAWGQEPTPRTDMIKDYGFRPGVAIEELLGVKKLSFNGVQNGMVTIFAAASADS